MPWQAKTPMDERICFVADYLRGAYRDFGNLCMHYGISRKSGYKWIARYQTEGMEGLAERSRRPHGSPLATPYAIRQQILACREQFRTPPGARKIQALLARTLPAEAIPSSTTIYNILRREGRVAVRRTRSRVPPGVSPFAPVAAANDVWSVDYKGQFRLANGQWCYPLTVLDQHSRYLLACRGLSGTKTADARRVFIRLFTDFGLPGRIRSDNGTPFAARTAGGLSRLAIWWVRLGILPERIAPGKPQQNGRHERMHRTLKKATTTPAATSFRAQQRRFDDFMAEYNEYRPHEALQQKPPASCYAPSPRPYPSRLPELVYPGHFHVHTVHSSGVVYSHAGQIYISHLLVGERVGLEEVDDGTWVVYFGPLRLGAFHLRDRQGGKTPYWTLRV